MREIERSTIQELIRWYGKDMQARITYRKIYMANGDDFYKKLKILLEMEYHACKNMHLTHTAFESN